MSAAKAPEAAPARHCACCTVRGAEQAALAVALEQLASEHPALRGPLEHAKIFAGSAAETAIAEVLRERVRQSLEAPLTDEAPAVRAQRLDEMRAKVGLFDLVGNVAVLLGDTQGLRAASAIHYAGATLTGVHPFIEFSGLMNTYVALCEEAHRRGIAYENANEHSGRALPMDEGQAAYLAEKLRCIFGPTLDANPEAAEAFRRALFKEGPKPAVPAAAAPRAVPSDPAARGAAGGRP